MIFSRADVNEIYHFK